MNQRHLEPVWFTVMSSPLGPLLMAGGQAGLTHIRFQHEETGASPAPDWQRDDAAFREAAAQLEAYFAGELRAFNLLLDPQGTPFQRRVWAALLDIPYGTTIAYGQLAQRVGQPDAARAVGAANGQNPLAIVIPCHRVVGSGGALTGYAGGLELKAALLAHERRVSAGVGKQLTLF